ncbi:hypothetical protein SERLA73DRAFT_77790 [Serpula lacrymans var. lacrymans S7.3]|uniref:CUE domain-containing protein n=2 Tax=Serpula lacrymans var. lacrymans TaxID=341189 RepID=F8QB00_SERL3|nr:uncharacterized protein SERLADRAFT_442690 [Serpula lacrymans var. lacrymans S7.9]EGN94386.1 hypothetical protein SERLA73DRAFT_77790 [Serpula lacrymans var. lacrymans S7.3]EGO19868.1 hypothetical protein SERLADRAFT_442690 [Serpula lacrymans var. lacrymans S7.9]
MGEVVNAIVASSLHSLILRLRSTGSNASAARSPTSALGFRPKNVTQEMVDQIHAMFPDIPQDNIRYDLLRTGNVELTSNKILEKGFLDAPPPAYYTLYPRTQGQAQANQQFVANATPMTPKDNLISRYRLQARLDTAPELSENEVGGKAKWEDTAEKREASLRERKAQMILAARQRLLSKQAQAEGGSSASSQNS